MSVRVSLAPSKFFDIAWLIFWNERAKLSHLKLTTRVVWVFAPHVDPTKTVLNTF
jgi:hypothetical protein